MQNRKILTFRIRYTAIPHPFPAGRKRLPAGPRRSFLTETEILSIFETEARFGEQQPEHKMK